MVKLPQQDNENNTDQKISSYVTDMKHDHMNMWINYAEL